MNCRSSIAANQDNHNALIMEAHERRALLERLAHRQGGVGMSQVLAQDAAVQAFLGRDITTHGSIPHFHQDSLYSLLAEGYLSSASSRTPHAQTGPVIPSREQEAQGVRRIPRATVARVLSEALDALDQNPF